MSNLVCAFISHKTKTLIALLFCLCRIWIRRTFSIQFDLFPKVEPATTTSFSQKSPSITFPISSTNCPTSSTDRLFSFSSAVQGTPTRFRAGCHLNRFILFKINAPPFVFLLFKTNAPPIFLFSSESTRHRSLFFFSSTSQQSSLATRPTCSSSRQKRYVLYTHYPASQIGGNLPVQSPFLLVELSSVFSQFLQHQ